MRRICRPGVLELPVAAAVFRRAAVHGQQLPEPAFAAQDAPARGRPRQGRLPRAQRHGAAHSGRRPSGGRWHFADAERRVPEPGHVSLPGVLQRPRIRHPAPLPAESCVVHVRPARERDRRNRDRAQRSSVVASRRRGDDQPRRAAGANRSCAVAPWGAHAGWARRRSGGLHGSEHLARSVRGGGFVSVLRGALARHRGALPSRVDPRHLQAHDFARHPDHLLRVADRPGGGLVLDLPEPGLEHRDGEGPGEPSHGRRTGKLFTP